MTGLIVLFLSLVYSVGSHPSKVNLPFNQSLKTTVYVDKCCKVSECLNNQLQCVSNLRNASKFFPQGLLIDENVLDVKPLPFKGPCQDETTMITNKDLKNFLLKLFQNEVELVRFKGLTSYKSGEFCLDSLEAKYAVRVCPCKAHLCLLKCCPFGQYYNTKQQHCRNLTSPDNQESVLKALKVNPDFRLVNNKLLKCGDEPDVLIKAFDDPSELMVEGKGHLVLQLEGHSTLIGTKRYCVDWFSSDGKWSHINGFYCQSPRKCSGPPGFSATLSNTKYIIHVKNQQINKLQAKHIPLRFPKPLYCHQEPSEGFTNVSTLIFIPCSEYICLQKCCPYDQQFDLNSFKCTQKTLAKPLGINSLDSQTALDYFLFEKLDNCHFVKLLHSNLGVDRLYLTNKGKLVQRVLQGFTETPPSRFCVDHFVNGRLWGVNGFLCNEDEEENSHHCLPDFKYLSKKNRKNGNNVTFIPNLTLIVVLSVLSSVQSDCFYLIF